MGRFRSEHTLEAIETMRSRLGAEEVDFRGRAVLLFSGGRDSSVVASAYCHAFPQSELHLLMIDNGLLSRMGCTKRQAELVKGLFPNTDIVFHVKRVSQMMREIGMQDVEKDFTERGHSTLLICLACKLIMGYSAMKYARETGINIVMDGYANRQRDYPEQTDEFMSVLRRVYQEGEVVYLSPLYELLSDKDLVNQMLSELGITIPRQEPVCMWANSFSTAEPKEITRYLERKLEQLRANDPILHV